MDAIKEITACVETAFDSFAKEGRSFNCKQCGTPFTPRKGQWIFYNLCDECFNDFNRQKMNGRLSALFGEGVLYHESYDKWRKANETI